MIDPSDRIFVAFDTETTGLSPKQAKVVEIAGVRFTGTGDEISRFSTLANPGDPMSPEVISIHGINDAMVQRAPTPTEACRQFAAWLHEDDVLVAHNAGFDVAFIATELKRGGLPCPRNRVLDTLRWARDLKLPTANCKLQTLVDHYGLPETGYHRAMADSLHVMQLMLRFLEPEPPHRLEQLMRRATVNNHDATHHGFHLAPRFATLPDAIDRGDVLEMRYDGDDHHGIPQRILPLTLCSIGETDYLMAQCMTDGGVKQFRLDRVIALSEGNPRRTYGRA